ASPSSDHHARLQSVVASAQGQSNRTGGPGPRPVHRVGPDGGSSAYRTGAEDPAAVARTGSAHRVEWTQLGTHRPRGRLSLVRRPFLPHPTPARGPASTGHGGVHEAD